MMTRRRIQSATEQVRDLVPRVVRERLLAKFGLVMAAILLVTAAVSGAIYVQTAEQLQGNAQAQMEGASALTAGQIAGWSTRMADRARLIARSPEARTSGTESVRTQVRAEAADLPGRVLHIHYVDTSSTEVLASSRDGATGTTLADRGIPWAGSAGWTESFRSRPYESPYSGTPGMAFVSPVPGRQRAVVLVANLTNRSLEFQQFGDRWIVEMVNSDGTVVMSHRTERIGTQYAGGPGVQSPVIERGLSAESGFAERTFDGTTWGIGYVPVGGHDWVMLTRYPTSQLYLLQNTILRFIVILVALSLVSLAVVGVVVSRNVVQSLDDLSERARELEVGGLDVDLASDRVDEIGRLYDSFDAMRGSLRERIDEAEAAREDAETARREAEALSEHLVAKAADYERVMQACAEGDLSRRVDPDSRSDAMAAIGESFNGMMDQLEAVTHQLKGFAEEVAAASEEVTAASEEVQSSADQVADSVQEISDGAEGQRDTLQSIAEEMNVLSTTIEEMAASASQVAETAERTAATGDDARETAQTAIAEMETVEREAEATVAAIEDLQDRMEQIEEITEFITEVAEQTNVLALNANIEAARAGEAGEGFAVVADEVKDLAEDTRGAAEEIEGLVYDLRTQTETTVEEVRATSEEVGHSTAAVEETVEALREIAEFAEETNVGIQDISDATAEQAASTNEVVSMTDDAASIAERTAEEASTVAGSSEEQTAALSEMTHSAGTLAAEANTLRESLEQFETDPERHQAAADSGLPVEEGSSPPVEEGSSPPVEEDD